MSIYKNVDNLWLYEYCGREIITNEYNECFNEKGIYHSPTSCGNIKIDLQVYLSKDKRIIEDIVIRKYAHNPDDSFKLTTNDKETLINVLNQSTTTRADNIYLDLINLLSNKEYNIGRYIFLKETADKIKFKDKDDHGYFLKIAYLKSIIELLFTFPIMLTDRSFINEHKAYFEEKYAELIWYILSFFCIRNGKPAVGKRTEPIVQKTLLSLKKATLKALIDEENYLNKKSKVEITKCYFKVYPNKEEKRKDKYLPIEYDIGAYQRLKDILFFHDANALQKLCKDYGFRPDFEDFEIAMLEKYERFNFRPPNEEFVDIMAAYFKYANTTDFQTSSDLKFLDIDISFINNIYENVAKLIFQFGSKETCQYVLDNYLITNDINFMYCVYRTLEYRFKCQDCCTLKYDIKNILENVLVKSRKVRRDILYDPALKFTRTLFYSCVSMMEYDPMTTKDDIIQIIKIAINCLNSVDYDYYNFVFFDCIRSLFSKYENDTDAFFRTGYMMYKNYPLNAMNGVKEEKIADMLKETFQKYL